MIEKEMDSQVNKDIEFIKQIQRLQKIIGIYEQLAEKVRTTSVMDRTIYSDDPNTDWLAIDRDDYTQIMDILSKLDLWKPWNHSIPPRITR